MPPLPYALGSSPGARFDNEVDYAYFHSFRKKTVGVLAGPFKDMLWTQVVLQACHEEPVLRSLVQSIGALEVCYDARMGDHGLSDLGPQKHEVYALEQYGKALGGVQKIAKSNSKGTIRTTLIAAMLIYCFENMYSETDTAIAHFLGALYCLRKELSEHSRSYRHLRNESPTPDLEDELVAAFVRLDCGILLRPYPTPSHVDRYILDCDFSESCVPAVFSSPTEARNHLEQFQFSALPGLGEVWASTLLNPGKTVIISDSKLKLAKTMSSNVHRWLIAFQPIFERAVASRDEGGPFIAEFTLQIQALGAATAAQMIWSAVEDTEQNLWLKRDMVEDSNTIITLGRAIVGDPGFYRGFTWDSGLVPGLFAMIVIGPNSQIRRQALEVMKSVVPRRENAWDSTSLVALGEASLQMCPADDVSSFWRLGT